MVVHDRDAHDEILSVLHEEKASETGVILHCFTGGRMMMVSAIAAGYFISFGGLVTFKKTPLVDVVPQVPLDRLLVETDSPYLAPVPFRGRRNEPSRVVHTAEVIAQFLDMPLDEVAEVTTRNACGLFRLPK